MFRLSWSLQTVRVIATLLIAVRLLLDGHAGDWSVIVIFSPILPHKLTAEKEKEREREVREWESERRGEEER